MPVICVYHNMTVGPIVPGRPWWSSHKNFAWSIATMDPFNMNVTLMNKTLEIERATRLDHLNWREVARPPAGDDDRSSLWQRLVSLFRVDTMKEATID